MPAPECSRQSEAVYPSSLPSPPRSRTTIPTLTSSQRGENRATQSTSAAWAEASRASDCSRSTRPRQLSASVLVIPISSPSLFAAPLIAITRTNGGDPAITATALFPSSGSRRTAAWQERFGMCTQPNSMATPSGRTAGWSRSSPGIWQTLPACGTGHVQPRHRMQSIQSGNHCPRVCVAPVGVRVSRNLTPASGKIENHGGTAACMRLLLQH